MSHSLVTGLFLKTPITFLVLLHMHQFPLHSTQQSTLSLIAQCPVLMAGAQSISDFHQKHKWGLAFDLRSIDRGFNSHRDQSA